MLHQISLGLFIIASQMIALSIGVDCFLHVAHFIVNMSNLGMKTSIFIICSNAFFQALEGAFEVSLLLIDVG